MLQWQKATLIATGKLCIYAWPADNYQWCMEYEVQSKGDSPGISIHCVHVWGTIDCGTTQKLI